MSSATLAIEAELRRRPEDWDSWLVYADALAERGDLRGQLIALEHRRATARLDDDQRERLAAEIADIVEQHQAEWTIPGVPERFELAWRNGFVVGVRLPLGADELERIAELFEHPQARLLASLRFTSSRRRHDYDDDHDDDYDHEYDPDREPTPIDAQLLEQLFALPLERISALAIEYTPLAANVAAPLRNCSRLTQLRELDLRYCQVGTPLAQALAGTGLTRDLEVLRLQRNRFDAEALRALVDAALERLRILDLRENPLGPDGAAVLAAARLPALETLHLYLDDIGSDGARYLAASDDLALHIRRYWAGRASIDS